MPNRKGKTVFVVSDGSGRTGEQVLRSALVQFEEEPVQIVVRPNVRSDGQIRKVIREANQKEAIIFFTLASETARNRMKRIANDRHVETVDILGPVFSGLHAIINRPPLARPDLLYQSEREYFDRMDAIDYTLKHDDGHRVHELKQADIVLVGVSRVSKSSTCFYLAYRGVRAANVPLIPGRRPCTELRELDSRRVVGLTVNSARLMAIRQTRLHSLGVDDAHKYVQNEAVAEEVRDASHQMSEHDWGWIDVSFMAIEEIAREVMQIMKDRKLRRRPRRRRRAPASMRGDD